MSEELQKVSKPVPQTAPAEAAGPARPGPSSPLWRRYIGAILRFKWLVLAVAVAGGAASVAATRFIRPVYTSVARIWIESTPPGGGGSGPIRSQDLLRPSAWAELLRSFEVLDHVVQERRLFLSAPADAEALFVTLGVSPDVRGGDYRLTTDASGRQYTLSLHDGTVVETGQVGDSIGLSRGILWQPAPGSLAPARAYAFRIISPRTVASGIRDNLRLQLDLSENFLTVSHTGGDPVMVGEVLQAITERYIEVAAHLKRAKLDTITTILSEQLARAELNLTQAELAHQSFRVNAITLPSERGAPRPAGLEETRADVTSSYFVMKTRLDEIEQDQEALRRVLASVGTDALATEALEFIPAAQASAELRATLTRLTDRRAELRVMQLRYTDDHPVVRDLIAEIGHLERVSVPALVSGLVAELGTQRRDLEGMVSNAATELRQVPPRALEEARLQRQVEIADNLYTNLRSRYEDMRLAALSAVPDVRILDPARIPQVPSTDQRPKYLFMGVFASFALALAGAIVLDRIDRRLRYPEQVTNELGLTILGTVPHVRQRRRRIDAAQAHQVVESLRSIRLNLMHAYGTAGPLTVTVTSPGVGDGKSFVASNLARTFAELGRRTIVVDADLRRGTLHNFMAVPRKPGLTDCLMGDIHWTAVVHETPHAGLSVLPCGRRTGRAPELLSTPSMRKLVADLRRIYDVVIIDSPPVGAAVDPLIIGTLTGSLLFVLRNGRTDREFTGMKLDVVERLPIRLLGAVLNDVPNTGVYRYYSYLPGYEGTDEVVTEASSGPNGRRSSRVAAIGTGSAGGEGT